MSSEVETPKAMEAVQPNSALAKLRAKHDEFQGERSVDLDVPGYDGALVARYNPLPFEDVQRLALRGEKGRRNPQVTIMVAADALALACEGLYTREADGSLTPLTWNGRHLRYGVELAELMEFEAESTREAVRGLFPDPMALVAHHGEFVAWQTGEADEEFENDDEVVGPLAN